MKTLQRSPGMLGVEGARGDLERSQMVQQNTRYSGFPDAALVCAHQNNCRIHRRHSTQEENPPSAPWEGGTNIEQETRLPLGQAMAKQKSDRAVAAPPLAGSPQRLWRLLLAAGEAYCAGRWVLGKVDALAMSMAESIFSH